MWAGGQTEEKSPGPQKMHKSNMATPVSGKRNRGKNPAEHCWANAGNRGENYYQQSRPGKKRRVKKSATANGSDQTGLDT